MSGTARWQHTSRKSGRWEWSVTRAIPRQAILLPRLGDMLGKRCRWTPLPRLATERHARCQRRVVHRVNVFPTFLTKDFNHRMIFVLCAVRPRRSPHRSDTRSLRMGITSAATGSWSALWLVAFGKDIKFGGAPEWSGALGSSSLAAKVRHGVAPPFSWRLSSDLT